MSGPPMVSVIWIDAHQLTDAWTELADIDDDGDRVVHSVGFLVPTKAGHICLAQSVDEERVDNVLAIPHGMVRRICRLEDNPLLPIEAAAP